jgi:hypothetical protein
VNIEILLCAHTLCCEYALANRTPSAASASMFGVRTDGFPNAPTASARS